MSAVVRSQANGRGSARSIVGVPPRANLLPPEIAMGAKLSRQRRGLIYLVLFSIVLVGLGYAYATLLSIQAQVDLDRENQQTAPILQEQATYSEVTAVQTQLLATEAASSVGASTAIDMETYITLVEASLPPGSSISGYSIAGTLPTQAYLSPVDANHTATVATLNFAVSIPALDSVSTWLHALETIPGFAGATISSVQGSSDGTFSVDLTMVVDRAALMNQPDETGAN